MTLRPGQSEKFIFQTTEIIQELARTKDQVRTLPNFPARAISKDSFLPLEFLTVRMV